MARRAPAETPTASSLPPVATVLSGRTMGTTYRIKYWGDGAAGVDQVQGAVDDLLARFDRQMSTYRDDSELSRFNRAPAEEWFSVSADTAHVVAKAIEYHRLTEGTLDVTVAPVLKLWRFGAGVKKDAAITPPTAEELKQAMALVGAQRLKVRDEPPALWKDIEGVEMDLSALAPGYAVDLIIGLLKSEGFANAMVEIGGEVRAAGVRADGKPWRIGVEHVGGSRRQLARIVPLQNLALSTAGDYRNFRTAGGKRYTHIIDPHTGQALPYRGASVTVLADTCLAADALDTALLVMGAEAGYKWCIDHDLAALFQEASRPAVRTTPRFDELTAEMQAEFATE